MALRAENEVHRRRQEIWNTKQMSPLATDVKEGASNFEVSSWQNNGWNVDRHVGYRRATTSKWHASHFSPYDIRTDEREVFSTCASRAMRSADKPGHVTRSSTVLIKYSAMEAPAQSVLMTWLNFMSLQSNTKTSRQVVNSSQAPVRYVPRVSLLGSDTAGA